MKYSLKKAITTDAEAVYSLVEKRIHWMNQKGIRQWNVTGYLEAYPIDYYREQQQQGNLYVLQDQKEKIVGAVVLLEADDRWLDRSDSSAFYIHNLVTDSEVHGAGSIMIQEAEKMAVQSGKRFMRLDCAVDNTFLNKYYKDRGFMLAGSCQEGLYIGNRREKELQL